jgi:hypothetical protein
MIAALALLLLAAPALAADPHVLFEERCGACHGDAGPFAHEALRLEGGLVRGRRSGAPVDRFLAGHFGDLDAAGIGLLVDTFRRQLGWGGIYRERCRICHDEARRLAQLELLQGDDGRLVGRYSGRDVEALLAGHGRLATEELPVVVEMLRWQLEVAGQ